MFLSTCSGVFGDRQATSLSVCYLFVCDNVNMSVFAICLGTGVYQNMGDGVCVCVCERVRVRAMCSTRAP